MKVRSTTAGEGSNQYEMVDLLACDGIAFRRWVIQSILTLEAGSARKLPFAYEGLTDPLPVAMETGTGNDGGKEKKGKPASGDGENTGPSKGGGG